MGFVKTFLGFVGAVLFVKAAEKTADTVLVWAAEKLSDAKTDGQDRRAAMVQ